MQAVVDMRVHRRLAKPSWLQGFVGMKCRLQLSPGRVAARTGTVVTQVNLRGPALSSAGCQVAPADANYVLYSQRDGGLSWRLRYLSVPEGTMRP